MKWNVKVLGGLILLLGMSANTLFAQHTLPKWQLGIKGWTELATAYQLQQGTLSFAVQPRLSLGGGILMRRWLLPHVGLEMGGNAISRGYQTPLPILRESTGTLDTLVGKRLEQWWHVPVGLCFRSGSWYAALGPFAEFYQDGHWRIGDAEEEKRMPLTQEELTQEVSFGAWIGTGFTLQLSQQLGLLTSLRAHVTDPIALPGRGNGNNLYTGNVNGGVNLGLLYQL